MHVSPLCVSIALSLALVLGASARSVRAAEELAYGVIVDTTNPRSMRMAREAGFTHAKMIIFWDRLETKRGRFAWKETSENDLDNVMKAARAEEMKLVVRVDGVPDWAGGSPANADPEAVARFYAAMADHGKGLIVGYEILNEPNLPFEWGGPPDPAGYTTFLKAAYRGVKKADPDAVVIGGGVSPATGGYGGTMEDFDFLNGMYRAGARGHMDALSVHNYGGNVEPEHDPGACTICFRRAERYRQVMVEHGDADTAVWATEFGWLLDPGRNMGQYDWMRVSAEKQAEYVVRSYRYAASKWSWMQGMLLSNLDASTSGYHSGPQNGMPWFAILNQDHSPRPAYKAFKAMREQEAPLARRPTTVKKRPPPPEGDPASSRASAAIPSTPPPVADQPELPAREVSAEPAPDPVEVAAAPEPVDAGGPRRLRVVRTDGDGLSVRTRPSTTAPRLEVVREGAVLELVGGERRADGRTWLEVRTSGGTRGWASAEYLEPADRTA